MEKQRIEISENEYIEVMENGAIIIANEPDMTRMFGSIKGMIRVFNIIDNQSEDIRNSKKKYDDLNESFDELMALSKKIESERQQLEAKILEFYRSLNDLEFTRYDEIPQMYKSHFGITVETHGRTSDEK